MKYHSSVKMTEIDPSDLMITDDGIIAEMIIEVDSGSESSEGEAFLVDDLNEGYMDLDTLRFNSSSSYEVDCVKSNTLENTGGEDIIDALKSKSLYENYIKSEMPDDDVLEFVTEVNHTECNINVQPKHDPIKRSERKYMRNTGLADKNRKDINKSVTTMQKHIGLGCGEKLGDISYIYHQVQKSQLHILKSFYRTLYFSSPSADIDIVRNEILTFNGFPFDKTSFEFSRRHHVIKLLCHQTVKDICLLLGIKFGIKDAMISNILDFLLKPHKKLDPLLDIHLQPVVQLKRLTEEFIASKIVAKETPSSKSIRKTNKFKSRNIIPNNETVRKLRSYHKVQYQTEDKSVIAHSPISNKKEISITQDAGSCVIKSEEERAEIPDLLQDTFLLELEDFETNGLDNLIDIEESPLDSKHCNKAYTDKYNRSKQRADFVISGCGEMLYRFPEIKKNISKAQQTVLQRLHILLFGKLDKPRKLKENILKFSGFSFEPKSVQWLRKEFILSLMSMDKLIEIRDVLNLLCKDCEQSNLIASIMKFLEKPEKHLLNSSLCKARNVQVRNSSTASSRKQQKYARKKIRHTAGRKKKILMDEDELNKLIKLDEANEMRNERKKKFDSFDDLKLSSKKRSVKAFSDEESSVPDNHSEINTMLQIIHERRAQKKANRPEHDYGMYYRNPKGKGVKLGMIPNVQFMIVTSNYDDLDDLHQLIFMHSAVRSKIRRKILDFDGFQFDEDSQYYEIRKLLLEKMGYEVSKRLAFFLGLTPLNTKIPQEDLNDLIMYFLMSPSHIKSVPIRNVPKNFFNAGIPRQRPVVELPSKQELKKMKCKYEIISKASKENKEEHKKSSPRANIVKIDVPSTTASAALLTDEQEDVIESSVPSAKDPFNLPCSNEAVSINCSEQNMKISKRKYESENDLLTVELKKMKFVDGNKIEIKLYKCKPEETRSESVSLLKESIFNENVSPASQNCSTKLEDKILASRISTENSESYEIDTILNQSNRTYENFKNLMSDSLMNKGSLDKNASLQQNEVKVSSNGIISSNNVNTYENKDIAIIQKDIDNVCSISSNCSASSMEQNNVLYKHMITLEASADPMSDLDKEKESEKIASVVKLSPVTPLNDFKSLPNIQKDTIDELTVSALTKQLISQSSVKRNAKRESVNLMTLTADSPKLLGNNSVHSTTSADVVLQKQKSVSEIVRNEDSFTENKIETLLYNKQVQSNKEITQPLKEVYLPFKDDSSKNSNSLTVNLENPKQSEINSLSKTLCEGIHSDGNNLMLTNIKGNLSAINEQPFHFAVTKTS